VTLSPLRLVLVASLLLAAGYARSQEAVLQPAIPVPQVLQDSVINSMVMLQEEALPAWHSMITHLPETWAGAYRRAFEPVQIKSLIELGAFTGAFVATDPVTWRWTKEFHDASQSHRDFADMCVSMGDGLPHFGTAAAFALLGFTFGDRRAIRTSSQITEALFATAIIVHTLKRIAGRQRPSRATRPGGVWDCFPNEREYNRSVSKFDAFPSGHLATTVATLTVIMENYPDAKWLRPVSYAVMGLVGFGLVNKGMHWYSDLPLAFAIGNLIGVTVAHPDGNLTDNTENQGSSVTLMPLLTRRETGIALDIVF
jgi:hypothetical protein